MSTRTQWAPVAATPEKTRSRESWLPRLPGMHRDSGDVARRAGMRSGRRNEGDEEHSSGGEEAAHLTGIGQHARGP